MLKYAIVVLTAFSCFGQSAPDKNSAPKPANTEKKFYQLNFVVRELEGEHVINSRSYSMTMGTEFRGAIRAGEKVPFASSSSVNGSIQQWQQIDVGANIDCMGLQPIGDHVAVRISAEISSVPEGHSENSPSGALPIIRNNRWESEALLPLRQPTVLYSSDDPASKRKMQLQVTVVPVP